MNILIKNVSCTWKRVTRGAAFRTLASLATMMFPKGKFAALLILFCFEMPSAKAADPFVPWHMQPGIACPPGTRNGQLYDHPIYGECIRLNNVNYMLTNRDLDFILESRGVREFLARPSVKSGPFMNWASGNNPEDLILGLRARGIEAYGIDLAPSQNFNLRGMFKQGDVVGPMIAPRSLAAGMETVGPLRYAFALQDHARALEILKAYNSQLALRGEAFLPVHTVHEQLLKDAGFRLIVDTGFHENGLNGSIVQVVDDRPMLRRLVHPAKPAKDGPWASQLQLQTARARLPVGAGRLTSKPGPRPDLSIIAAPVAVVGQTITESTVKILSTNNPRTAELYSETFGAPEKLVSMSAELILNGVPKDPPPGIWTGKLEARAIYDRMDSMWGPSVACYKGSESQQARDACMASGGGEAYIQACFTEVARLCRLAYGR